MKKVVLIIAAVVLTTPFFSCKEKTEVPSITETEFTENLPSEELALLNSSEIALDEYRYVTAPSGLSLREYNNLQSKKWRRCLTGQKLKSFQLKGKIP
ncbi:MAG: hypothetical protein R2786_01370 [Flavobacteriaceae bacterium]